MKNMKFWRTALVATLVLTVMLSVTGGTIAWFTDEVTSGNNIIKSGNLDVEMYWADGAKAVPADDSADWKDAAKGAIFKYDLWEPGYTQVRHIKIANVGNLALKYKVNISANGEVSDLANVIDVYYMDPASQVANRGALTDANKLGTLTEVLAKMGETGSGSLLAGTADTITLAFKMQESAGNDYQNKSIGSDFSVILMATQLTEEDDSFDDQYDKDAEYPVEGTVTVAESGVAVNVGTKKINVTIPAGVAKQGDVYEVAVSNENIETNEKGKTTASFDLSLYKNNIKVSGDTVYEVNYTIEAGRFIDKVTQNGTALKKATTTGVDQTYTYDSATGVLTIYTKSFSPFVVTYDKFWDSVPGIYATTATSEITTSANFSSIVNVSATIVGCSIFDGDDKITNEVRFRFTELKRETIDENSYKVSFNLAILDDAGKDLELKPGKSKGGLTVKEYLHLYMNLQEVPEGYAVTDVKVNGKALTVATGNNPATGEYKIGSMPQAVYLQTMTAGDVEVILEKAN